MFVPLEPKSSPAAEGIKMWDDRSERESATERIREREESSGFRAFALSRFRVRFGPSLPCPSWDAQPLEKPMTREEAMSLLHEYTQSESLRKHAYAVEAAMRAYARKLGGDEERWGLTGLLHDFDYERWPDPPEHTRQGAPILRERGVPEEVVRAILSHADWNELPRETPMEKALFAVDELAGFVTAVAYVRPSKKLADVDVTAVKKKMKDKAFARAVRREDIIDGAATLGVPLEEHIATVIAAMQGVSDQLGL
jgi:putative nucleotidyltransferase with HDIG domain